MILKSTMEIGILKPWYDYYCVIRYQENINKSRKGCNRWELGQKRIEMKNFLFGCNLGGNTNCGPMLTSLYRKIIMHI